MYEDDLEVTFDDPGLLGDLFSNTSRKKESPGRRKRKSRSPQDDEKVGRR